MTAPKNVECQTCGGKGYCVDSLTFPPDQIGQPCPDCTPGNVDTPFVHTDADGSRLRHEFVAPMRGCAVCGKPEADHPTPENVKSPIHARKEVNE